MLNVERVHVYSPVTDKDGKSHMRLTEFNPYILVKSAGQAVMLQRGKFYEQSGNEMLESQVPAWVEQYVKTTIDVEFLQQEGGFTIDEDEKLVPWVPKKPEPQVSRKRK